jgi:hypothetical protein
MKVSHNNVLPVRECYNYILNGLVHTSWILSFRLNVNMDWHSPLKDTHGFILPAWRGTWTDTQWLKVHMDIFSQLIYMHGLALTAWMCTWTCHPCRRTWPASGMTGRRPGWTFPYRQCSRLQSCPGMCCKGRLHTCSPLFVSCKNASFVWKKWESIFHYIIASN